jgi:hypothetical protein
MHIMAIVISEQNMEDFAHLLPLAQNPNVEIRLSEWPHNREQRADDYDCLKSDCP